MGKDRLPPDWDWVTERYQCSALKMFETLRAAAKKNVETMNALVSDQRWEFADSGGSFFVGRQVIGGVKGVRFLLGPDTIEVESQGVKVSLLATLTLNDEGECRFLVAGELLEVWHARFTVLH